MPTRLLTCLVLGFALFARDPAPGASAEDATPAPSGYAATDLGTLGGRYSDADAVNAAGPGTDQPL